MEGGGADVLKPMSLRLTVEHIPVLSCLDHVAVGEVVPNCAACDHVNHERQMPVHPLLVAGLTHATRPEKAHPVAPTVQGLGGSGSAMTTRRLGAWPMKLKG